MQRTVIIWIAIIFVGVSAWSQEQWTPERIKNRILRQVGVETFVDTTRVHDPVIIKDNDRYYIFSTGWGVSMYSSEDMKTWRSEMPVFMEPPQWAFDTVPGYNGHTWAPDITYYNNQYILYYSISTFGKNRSAIGVATNVTLNPESEHCKWVDHGPIIISTPGKTNWNAIDPNFVLDDSGHPYLSFGSFWGGLVLVRLTDDGLSVEDKVDDYKIIATRKLRNNSVEAPFIFKKEGWYYLFASYDFCCRGAESTYKVVVGRSRNVDGEYIDEEGNSMLEGGGTLVVQGNDKYAGVGHNAVATFNGIDYLLFHAYDMERKGASFLRILPITWADGWPKVAQDF